VPWTDPRTWVTGELVDGTMMNTHVRDNLRAVLHPLAQSGATVLVSNSTVQTSLGSFTVPANTMGANGVLDVLYQGEQRAQTSSNLSGTVRISLGGVTVLSGSYNAQTYNVNQDWKFWELIVRVINLGSTGSQFVSGNFRHAYDSGTNDTTTRGSIAYFGVLEGAGHAYASVDTTVDRIFDATIQLSNANANFEFRKSLLRAAVASV